MLRKEWAFYPKNALKSTFVKESYMQQSAFDTFAIFIDKSPQTIACVNSNENGNFFKAKGLERLMETQMQKPA